MAAPPVNLLSVCAGIGGIDLGLRLAIPGLRTVCYVEREAYAAAVLAARMEEGRLDPAPIWSDVANFDGTEWRGCVDILAAGFPCQPFSFAGKRQGEDDERFIWPDIARIIGECRPGYVFLENVALDAFRRPRADLADMGYRVPPAVCIGAVHVGAPHRRLRWWCLAVADAIGAGLEERQGQQGHDGEERQAAERGGPVGNSIGVREPQPEGLEPEERRCLGHPRLAGN